MKYLSFINKLIANNILFRKNSYFPLLILIFSCASFLLLKNNFSAFEQNTHTFIPGLEFLNNPNILDFYSLSILNSPKITTVYLINFLFSDWYYGTYFFKVLLNINIYLAIWFLLLSTFKYHLEPENIRIDDKIFLILIISFVLLTMGLLKKFQGPGSANGPLGYGSIQYLSDFNEMNLSFVFGVYGIIAALEKKRILNFLTIIIISSSTIIHPTMGLSNLILLIILYSKKIDFNYIKQILILIIPTILIPAIFLKILSSPDPLLGGKDFFDIYVKYRHPHHFLVSDKLFKINFHSFLMWLFFFTSMLIFSYKYSKKIILLNFLILLTFIAIPISQYFLVEVLHIKLFIELGITRFTTLISIIFFIQVLINLIYFLKKKVFISEDKQLKKINLKSQILINLLVGLIFTFIITSLTYTHPLNDKKFSKYHPITSWVSKNISDNREFFIQDQKDIELINFLRIFGKQNIYYDDEGFPFSSKYIIEYINRKEYYEKINEKLNIENRDINNLKIDDKIGYILFKKANKNLLNSYDNIIYEDDYFIIEILN